jgi:hypothetical protein
MAGFSHPLDGFGVFDYGGDFLPGWRGFPPSNLFFERRLRRCEDRKVMPFHFMKSTEGGAPLQPISVSRQWGANPPLPRRPSLVFAMKP